MRQFIEFISKNNQSSNLSQKVLSKIDYNNNTYKEQDNIDITLVNPYNFDIEKDFKKQGLYVICKQIDIEDTLLKIVHNIPRNTIAMHYIDFLGFKKIDTKLFPSFRNLIDKRVFIMHR